MQLLEAIMIKTLFSITSKSFPGTAAVALMSPGTAAVALVLSNLSWLLGESCSVRVPGLCGEMTQ